MKKILAVISLFIISTIMFSGCGNGEGKESEADTFNAQEDEITVTVDETPDVTEETDYVTEKWVCVEIPFTAATEIKEITDAEIDVTFTNRTTGTKLTMPAFWDGGRDWKVRFAPTECGIWDYTLSFTGADLAITTTAGTVACNTYKGDLDIYKHGFVGTTTDQKYFAYADGTPFFYLGDTHWGMLCEEYDSAGSNAGDIQTDSHFKYIVDKRVEQGFTVYQSEPIGHGFIATDGIKKSDIKGFQKCDLYFQYIAQKGMVHANAELFFPDEIPERLVSDYDELRAISRYWVARYGAYPVMWTLGQEVDNDFFGYVFTIENNPYVFMAKYISECDPYNHPLTGHQENTVLVGAKGGVPSVRNGKAYINEKSVFLGVSYHTWWGVQWHPTIDEQYNFLLLKDFWENGEGKPAVLYETDYENLATNTYGARARGYMAYLSGLYGYGYGCQDIWYYKSGYGKGEDSRDGANITVTKEDKNITWGEAIKLPTGDQLTYMRNFFEKLAWWKLTPDFDYKNAYEPDKTNEKALYAVAYNKDKVYVAYFYNETTDTAGSFINMSKNATYTAQWYNTVTNQYTTIDTAIKAEKIGETYGYKIPEKPLAQDMVLLVTKN